MGIILFNTGDITLVLTVNARDSFRPLMGIILFNQMQKQNAMLMALLESFRPLMGIILFNKMLNMIIINATSLKVSVP